jgi:hypothetical protein
VTSETTLVMNLPVWLMVWHRHSTVKNLKTKLSLFLINHFTSGVAEDSSLPGSYAEPLGEKLPTFRKFVVTSSSESSRTA